MINITHTHSEGLYYYMIFNLAAILVGVAGAGLAAKKSKFGFRDFAVIVSTGILFLIIGSKLVLFNSAQWLSFLTEGNLPAHTGKSIVGAIVGGMIGAWGAGRLLGNKQSVLDLCALSFPLAMAVQRLGCLFAGCCHGTMTSMPWGITYGPGAKPYLQQQQMGLISPDAITSLPIHPDQIYNILACIFIAVIAWKTSARWKSPSGKFLFSVILYLAFRFMEEFTRFSFNPVEWMGLRVIQWKALSILLILGLTFILRERYYSRKTLISTQETKQPVSNLKILFISVLVLGITFQIGGWLSSDERTTILLTVLPLCGIVIMGTCLWTVMSKRYVKFSCLVLLAFGLMSQKVDKPKTERHRQDIPEITPKSYTSYNLTTATGQFNFPHEFNYRIEPHQDCEGNTVYGPVTDVALYKSSYKIGGIGISRKIYYNQWRSLLASLNIYGGTETQTPIANSSATFIAPTFHNTLFGINPMIQFDGRAMGFGLGGSVGLLGHDIPDDPSDRKDYNPKTDVRKATLQARIRLFSERFVFIEAMGGYDLGSVGDYNTQVLFGSRFNGHKYMMKAGFAWSKHEGQSLVMHGQMRVSPRLFLSPQIMINHKVNDGPYKKNGYRVALGLEYRINDK